MNELSETTPRKPGAAGPAGPAGVSPYATGGGGVTLERRVAVTYLADLLTGTTRAELTGRRLRRVVFQAGPARRVDDLMIVAEREDGSELLELNIAVRRAPDFVSSDTDTKKLFAALIAEIPGDEPQGTQRRLAICVAGSQTAAKQVGQLAALAEGQVTPAGFYALVRTPRRFERSMVERLRHLVNLVQANLSDTEGGGSIAAAEETTWRLLRHLAVLMPRVEAPDETDWGGLLNQLAPWAREPTAAAATALRDRLESLAAEYGPASAEVDLAKLRRDAHDVLHSERRRRAAGWTELRRLEGDARNAVRDVLGVDGAEPALHLERADTASGIRAALDIGQPVLVTGESGVGKSAVVIAELIAAAARDPLKYDTVCLNLRLLPPTVFHLRQSLGVPLEDLLAEMSAPTRILAIDGADVAIERDDHLLQHVLGAARRADVTPWVITAVDGSAAVRAVTTNAVGKVRDIVVPGLGDAELEQVAQAYPQLRRLVDEPRARELLRRPAVTDLFVRSGTGGLPLSDADALDIVWSQLVRNNENRARGLPEARDHVMRQLASQQLRPTDAAVTAIALDQLALSGLVHDGLLRRADRWQTLPTFAHDLLRTYAVAVVLLSTGDPVGELLTSGAPRWALPAARLAAQALLAAPDSPEAPFAGRLGRLQGVYERLTRSGHGDRWSDLPTEALLTLPAAGAFLADAWPVLVGGDAVGLRRLVRVVQQRHGGTAVIERLIAEPVVELLLERGWPQALDKEVNRLFGMWLRGLVRDNEPAGHRLRITLRSQLVGRVAVGDARLAVARQQEAEQLAARTSEEIADDEERARRLAAVTGVPSDHPRRRLSREVPDELIDGAVLEQLALLGTDLGQEGEALLRRVADDAPHHLAPVLEQGMTGRALASYSTRLLIELVEAYYIEEDGHSHALGHDGIRHHERGSSGPLAAFYLGPFLALLQADLRNGVACLNRLLNHAVRARVDTMRGPTRNGASRSVDDCVTELDVTGERRRYVGDAQTWLWYRGTGVGPYPCMSALQALEFVCDQYLTAGVEPARLIQLLLDGCENLAMAALVVGMLTRHLERVGAEMDPFLAEPALWRLEFARITQEGSGLAARTEGIVEPERRRWNLRDVAARLALSASGDRIDALQAVAQRLVARATELEGSADGGDELSEGLAAVRGWAAGLDRDTYALTRTDQGIRVEQEIDPDITVRLAETNANLARGNEAAGIVLRYPDRFDRHAQRRESSLDEVVADVALAGRLLDDPPIAAPFGAHDAAAAVAAGALEARFIHRIDVPDGDLAWSARLLVGLMNALADHDASIEDFEVFGTGPDRAAARGLPLLALPDAAPVRGRLANDGVGPEAVARAVAWIVGHAANETRLFLARAYDPLWHTPCDSGGGVCHHVAALAVIENIARDCLIGDWNFEHQRIDRVHIDGRVVLQLATTNYRVYVPQLTATIRGASAAAASSACCRSEARELLGAALDAHRRGMRGFKHGYQHSGNDCAAAARAVVDLAATGDPSLLFAHLDGYADRPRQLSDFLRALIAVGEESATRAAAAAAHWPRVFDRVVQLATTSTDDADRYSDRTSPLADVIPAPAYDSGYLHRELEAEPILWADPVALTPQIERWLPLVAGQRRPLDALVHMLYRLSAEQQAVTGLPWIERLVMPNPVGIASQSFLLPEWLERIRSHATTPALQAAWHRIVDALTVAGDNRIAAMGD